MKNVVMMLTVAVGLGFGTHAVGQVNAEFDIRLGGTEVDAIIDPGETLDLDVYLRLSSASSLPDVTGWSAFFDLDLSEDNVVSFTGLFFDLLGFSTVLPNGTDNSPESGDFGRSLLASPQTLPADTWLLAARFRVLALTPGSLETIGYSLTDAPPSRPWTVALDGGGFADVSLNSSQAITVTPEPSAAFLLISGMGLIGLRRRRIGT